MVKTDYAYRAAEKQRKRAMCADELGDKVAGFFALFVLALWLLDIACWAAR